MNILIVCVRISINYVQIHYNAVCDAVSAGERDPAAIGQRVYLPASFMGMLLI